eukprot:c19177_g3_i1 orf=265-441(-)
MLVVVRHRDTLGMSSQICSNPIIYLRLVRKVVTCRQITSKKKLTPRVIVCTIACMMDV